ncbi:MAG TPA: EAL domain-containing protein [Burkholderiaceae bacterium]|nr:EAL domain-containing protein [Burkholderiaceae bacterium]
MKSKPTSDLDGFWEGARADNESLQALIAQSSDWYWETDALLRLVLVRGAGQGAFDPPAAQWLGKLLWQISGESGEPPGWAQYQELLEARRPFAGLVLRCALDAQRTTVQQLCGVPMYAAAREFVGYAGVGRDITAQLRMQETVRDLASVDPLTRLLNRQAFDERAQGVLSDAYTRGHQCALLCIGLDRFRLLNSVYGHRVGDRMLESVAARLRQIVRPPDLLGRRGGDEIVALLVNVANPDLVADVARQVMAALARSEHFGALEVSVRASVGVGFFPKDGGDLDALLNAAEAALFRAKESGGGAQALFTPELARRTELRVLLEQRFRKAYESRDFRLFYQPLVSLPEADLVGAEALLRWKDAELGDISPGEFIPIAEESGLIEGVGEWVLREACRQRQLWRQIGLELPPIAINVSGVQMRNGGFVDSLLSTLDEFALSADELEIEITETGLIECLDTSRENLLRLRSAGIKAALDDFGVGYSSLAHLRDLPMHRLKIDRSFTIECMRDARTLTIVKSLIEMAHNLGLTVTAEGIETPAQQAWMHHLGCDSAQGFVFAQPMPAEEFLARFLEGRARDLQRV